MMFICPQINLYPYYNKVEKKGAEKPYKPTVKKSIVVKQPSLTRRLMPANKIDKS